MIIVEFQRKILSYGSTYKVLYKTCLHILPVRIRDLNILTMLSIDPSISNAIPIASEKKNYKVPCRFALMFGKCIISHVYALYYKLCGGISQKKNSRAHAITFASITSLVFG